MHLVLLAGNSKLNKEWIEDVESSVKELFDSTYIHYYKHWDDENAKLLDFDLELSRLQKELEGKEDYVIFAKSAGALLTLRGISEGILNPSKCVFAGVAVNWGLSKGLPVDTWLEAVHVPSLFIQKTDDPAISFEELREFIRAKGVENFTMIEQEGDDHHYGDLELLKKEMRDFLKEK
jgi:hypothetical protein